ncbi:NRAMP family divalent metal transporter [Pseudoalteromonas fenneropenaei]|uniref:NRAMP family divalent metal transporter n=1 Tax=Pseudoalteromonas fenneropenaei TaxID=1737459 RepID=A0ABV7CNA9_9GAMM
MTFAEKLKGFGPGILLATAAVGGSHLVAATQAGALFGWQLLWLILVVNLLKYPFFRFGVEYTLRSQQSLVAGYREQGPWIFYSFIALNIVAAIVNTAGVLLLTASLLHYVLPWQIELSQLCVYLLLVCMTILLFGHYKLLDSASKVIMALLTLATLAALAIALANGPANPAPVNPPDPFQLAMLGFLVVLMGWMPAPIEISAINSLWLKAKARTSALSLHQGLLDFNTGYILTAVLAAIFCALGVLIQYGSSAQIELAGAAFSKQLIDMYTQTIGEWSRHLVATIAFLCMFGTTLTVLDGYARTLDESARLLKPSLRPTTLNVFLLIQALLGLAVVLFFKANLKAMLTFAMSLAFVTTPLFAYFNLRLMTAINNAPTGWLKILTRLGLVYLFGFTLLYLYWQFA